MVKVIEAIVVLTLLVFSFFIGVKYSESVKSHASWLFEGKEEEVELPDLSNENNGELIEGETQEGVPMDSIEAPSDSNAGIDESSVTPTAPEAAPAPLVPAASANKPAVKPSIKK